VIVKVLSCAALTMLDLLTQKTSSSYKFYRGHQPKGVTYYKQWSHFFVVPSPVLRSFLGDNLVDPEGSRIRLRIPPPVRPLATGPAGGAAAAGPAGGAVAAEPAGGAVAAEPAAGVRVVAATTSRPDSPSSREIAKGKRKIVVGPLSSPPPIGNGFYPCLLYWKNKLC
jgi:hypothetical protein